jgi:hypothetical protein
VDPHAGPYAAQRALVFHPDDPLFARFRWQMEREQGTRARPDRRPPRQPTLALPDWLEDELAETRARHSIIPLESNALTLRLSLLRPGPDLAAGLAMAREPASQGDLLTPSMAERQLRQQLSALVAAQAVEDAAEGVSGAISPPRGAGLYHAYNAALKRVLGGKARHEMSLAELEAAAEWLGRHRLHEHLHLLEGDQRFGWAVRTRQDWSPPVGRASRLLPGKSSKKPRATAPR